MITNSNWLKLLKKRHKWAKKEGKKLSYKHLCITAFLIAVAANVIHSFIWIEYRNGDFYVMQICIFGISIFCDMKGCKLFPVYGVWATQIEFSFFQLERSREDISFLCQLMQWVGNLPFFAILVFVEKKKGFLPPGVIEHFSSRKTSLKVANRI